MPGQEPADRAEKSSDSFPKKGGASAKNGPASDSGIGFFRLPLAAWALLLGALLLRAVQPDIAYFNIHAERDLYRAAEILRGQRFHMTGPEMSYGGKTFGPFVYFIYMVPLLFSADPAWLTVFAAFANVLGMWMWYVLARRHFGPRLALWSLAFWALHPMDVAQSRFLWNPSFLAPFVTLWLWGLFLACAEKRPAGYLLMAFGWAASFQLHFSALPYFFVSVIACGVCRAPRSLKHIAGAGAILLAMFLPFLVHDFRAWGDPMKKTVSKPALKAEDARKDARIWQPNPNFLRVAPRNLTFALDEAGYQQGFCYLLLFKNEALAGGLPAWAMAAVWAMYGASWLLVAAFLAGVAAWLSLWRRAGEEPGAFPSRTALALLAAWLLPVLAINSMFNLHPPPPGAPTVYSLVPPRYFRVAWPAQFLVAAMGLAWLGDRRGCGLQRRMAAGVAAAVPAMGLAFSVAVLIVLGKAGAVIPYASPGSPYGEARVPHVGRMREMARFLASHGLSGMAYRENVAARGVLTASYGEASLDWMAVVWAPRTLEPPRLGSPDLHAYIYPSERAPFFTKEELAAGLEIIERRDFGDIRVVVFRAEPEALPAWWNDAREKTRNHWIRDIKPIFGSRPAKP